MTTEVVVALIAGFAVVMAGVPSAFIERARRENADDHATVRRRLDRIDEHLDEIEDSVDDVAEVVRRRSATSGSKRSHAATSTP